MAEVRWRRPLFNTFSTALGLCAVMLVLTSSSSGQWVAQKASTKSGLRGLSVVNRNVIWASGTGGTVIRTINGGKTWNVVTVPGAEKLDFRDIEAFDAKTAYALSIGNGEASRIYKTVDGGATWQEQFRNNNEKAFFDAIACWDVKNCVAMSDPVDGKFLLIRTANGETWSRMDSTGLPAAIEGEAAFAASGTCLITHGARTAFLVSGGSTSRVFRTADRGVTWKVADAPIIDGTPGSGIFSIAMRDSERGVIVGGNYEKPNEAKDSLAFWRGSGRWVLGAGLTGYRSAVSYIDKNSIIAVGPNGTDLSLDGGKTWKKIGGENLNAVAAKGKRAVWAVGPSGLVVKLKH